MKILSVSQSVDIPKLYNFSRWFKAITGTNAKIWRNQHRILEKIPQ